MPLTYMNVCLVLKSKERKLVRLILEGLPEGFRRLTIRGCSNCKSCGAPNRNLQLKSLTHKKVKNVIEAGLSGKTTLLSFLPGFAVP